MDKYKVMTILERSTGDKYIRINDLLLVLYASAADAKDQSCKDTLLTVAAQLEQVKG